MRKTASRAAVPIIEIIKTGAAWEVHWDYQEAPESSILFQRGEYLRGYIDGTLDDLGIHPDNVLCASALTGTVKKLNEDQAAKLRDALNRVLIPIVTNEFTRLQKMSDLPHLRMVGAEEA
ncbi:hypothetical protein [Pseudomonas fluorescens]|uniref:hypothetical protein n=1 Tax=Pseudomonas fluorescens TaxID=294 RepID=UPI001240A108|nr:hypothetical protein [Pseudomonas fluorescens]VVQ30702.1 hypothetical protein PS947_02080 [Pseudomonas fluorescens]